MNCIDRLNEALSLQAAKIKDEINKHISEATVEKVSNPPECIESKSICILDIQYGEKFVHHLTNVFNDLRDKVAQTGHSVRECAWENIRDDCSNPFGNVGKFVVILK